MPQSVKHQDIHHDVKTSALAGAALASTPAQSGQRYLPKSRTNNLIAPSLAKLPNALDAEYWLNKIKVHEDLGNYQVIFFISYFRWMVRSQGLMWYMPISPIEPFLLCLHLALVGVCHRLTTIIYQLTCMLTNAECVLRAHKCRVWFAGCRRSV